MTDPSDLLAWSVTDAQNARAKVEVKHSPLRHFAAPLIGHGTAAGSRALASLFGPKVYQPRLQKVAAHMNRNRDAFDRYTPVQGDVVVSAYFKAGTNWIMHVCHQICHLGLADFDHIQDVIPWPDAAEPRFWINVNDPSPRATATGLRVIKSHLSADRIPINGTAKYIAVTRDPKDCAASAYHFFRALVFGRTMPPPAVWLEHFMSRSPNFGRWDKFTATWHSARDHSNVMFLCFEDVKQDRLAAIRRIAGFLDVELSDEQLDLVAKVTSFEPMKQINHKFYPPRQSVHTNPVARSSAQDASGMREDYSTLKTSTGLISIGTAV